MLLNKRNNARWWITNRAISAYKRLLRHHDFNVNIRKGSRVVNN